MVKIKLPQMTEHEINLVLEKENICRIAFIKMSIHIYVPFNMFTLKINSIFILQIMEKK